MGSPASRHWPDDLLQVSLAAEKARLRELDQGSMAGTFDRAPVCLDLAFGGIAGAADRDVGAGHGDAAHGHLVAG